MSAIHRPIWRAASVAALLLSLAATAGAGLIPESIKLGFTPPGPPPWAGQHGPPPFVFDLVPGNSALGKMQIGENFAGLDPLDLRVSGESTTDPIIEIIKSVTNSSGSTWTGYQIGLGGGSNTFVAGSASSDKLSFIPALSNSNLLTFGLPSPVPNGQSVTFDFKVSIPDSGPFQFDLSQSPIVPEPASALLAAMGVGIVWGLRRRITARR